jgi:hypothetical protein
MQAPAAAARPFILRDARVERAPQDEGIEMSERL